MALNNNYAVAAVVPYDNAAAVGEVQSPSVLGVEVQRVLAVQ